MKSSPTDIHQVANLAKQIRSSSDLKPDAALVFDMDVQRMPLYQKESELQTLHSKAILDRMRKTQDVHAMRNMSEMQEKAPLFSSSPTLQELFAKGLVLIAQKDTGTEVHEDLLGKLRGLSGFKDSLEIQRAAAALLLESIANCKSPRKARDLERRFWSLPMVSNDPEIRKMANLSRDLTEKTDRQAVVKVDLRQKLPGLVRAFGKFIGMGDYRMRVWLGGDPRYKHVVVKVAARSEEAAKQAVQEFIDDFFDDDKAAAKEVVDVFPPGSAWESGPYPVLKL